MGHCWRRGNGCACCAGDLRGRGTTWRACCLRFDVAPRGGRLRALRFALGLSRWSRCFSAATHASRGIRRINNERKRHAAFHVCWAWAAVLQRHAKRHGRGPSCCGRRRRWHGPRARRRWWRPYPHEPSGFLARELFYRRWSWRDDEPERRKLFHRRRGDGSRRRRRDIMLLVHAVQWGRLWSWGLRPDRFGQRNWISRSSRSARPGICRGPGRRLLLRRWRRRRWDRRERGRRLQ